MGLAFLAVRIGGACLAGYSIFQVGRGLSLGAIRTFGPNPSVTFAEAPGGFAFWLVGWTFAVAVGIFLMVYSRWLEDRS